MDLTESPFSDKEAEGISKLLEALFADQYSTKKRTSWLTKCVAHSGFPPFFHCRAFFRYQ